MLVFPILSARGALLLLAVALPLLIDPPAVRGQQVAIADAILRARRTDPAVRAAREALAGADGAARQARALPNPVLSLQVERAGRSGFDDSQSILTVDQALDFAQRGSRIDAARHRREAAAARLADAESRSDLAVVRAYAQVASSGRRARLAREAAAVFARARGVSAQRFAAGDISGYADRRVRLEAARYAALELEALLTHHAAQVALASLLTSGSPGDLAVSDTTVAVAEGIGALIVIPGDVGVDSMVAAAHRRRADLRAVEADAAAALADSRAISRSRIPAPVVTVGLKRVSTTGADDLSGLVAGIALPLPLLDRRGGAVDASAADARRTDAELALLRRRAAEEVRSLHAAVATVESQLRALAPELGETALQALRSAEVAYVEGEIPLVEWLDAVRAHQEAESAFATLTAESLVRRAALRRAAGLPIIGTQP